MVKMQSLLTIDCSKMENIIARINAIAENSNDTVKSTVTLPKALDDLLSV